MSSKWIKNINSFLFSIRSRVIIVSGNEINSIVFIGGWRTYPHRNERNRRTFARRNISELSAFSLERAPFVLCPNCWPTPLQCAINYANWSSGYRPGTAMHVNVRKDICFPSACIRFKRTQRQTYIRDAQFALGVCPTFHWEVNTPVSVHVCDKCALQLRANAFERTSARHVTLFNPLSLSFYLDFL